MLKVTVKNEGMRKNRECQKGGKAGLGSTLAQRIGKSME